MPRYYETEMDNDTEMKTVDGDGKEEVATSKTIHHWRPLLLLTFFYYLISCGIERIYQPMVGIATSYYYTFVTLLFSVKNYQQL